MAAYDKVLVEIAEGVATLTLHRPEKLNALDVELCQDLIAALEMATGSHQVRVIVLTGAGRGFCAGADLSAGGDTFDRSTRAAADSGAKVGDVVRDGGGRLTLRIFDSLKPVIAACNGPAVGVGVTMQLAMDIRLASTEARYGFVFARRGLNPEACSSWFLPHLVGVQTALEWCFTGRVFPAAEAHAKGLVRSLHAPDELMPAARALAREIADNTAPVSVAITRQLIWRMAGARHPMEAHMADSRGIQLRGAMADVREGVTSFLEKRQPKFPDRVSKDLPDVWPQWRAPEFR